MSCHCVNVICGTLGLGARARARAGARVGARARARAGARPRARAGARVRTKWLLCKVLLRA